MQRDDTGDVAALQGCWEQIALEADGVSSPPDPLSPPHALTTFTGNHFEVRSVEGAVLLAGTFVLDASTTPKSITWTDSMGEDMGQSLAAIYKLDGDDFVFIAASPGLPRPTVFATAVGHTMRTFVRRR